MDLQIGGARIEPECSRNLRPVHPVNLAHPYDSASILSSLKLIFNGSERIRAVMLRPVELNAPGDPRTRKADQSRLDYAVIIDKIIVIRLVERPVDPPSKLRHDLYAQIFILQNNQLVRSILLHIRDALNHGMRVYTPRASLIDSFLQKHRTRISGARLIGWYNHTGLPYLHPVCSVRIVHVVRFARVVPGCLRHLTATCMLHAFTASLDLIVLL